MRGEITGGGTARAGIGAAILIAGLSGCATRPAFVAVNHQRIVPLATRDVWRRVHAFLSDEGIAVVSEDAAAGIIDAQRAVDGKGSLTGLANCGSRPLHPPRRQTLSLTVLVKPEPDGSKVIANAVFTETLASRRAGALTVACASSGVLEAAVLDVASGQPMQAAVIPQ